MSTKYTSEWIEVGFTNPKRTFGIALLIAGALLLVVSFVFFAQLTFWVLFPAGFLSLLASLTLLAYSLNDRKHLAINLGDQKIRVNNMEFLLSEVKEISWLDNGKDDRLIGSLALQYLMSDNTIILIPLESTQTISLAEFKIKIVRESIQYTSVDENEKNNRLQELKSLMNV